jgi:hypothetical protein
VISCNGCTDATAALAREYPDLLVAEISKASKPQALNEGDRIAGDVFPRLYIDADAQIDLESIRKLIDALQISTARAVRPESYSIMNGAPWIVRTYMSAREVAPQFRLWSLEHLEGHAIYGTNRIGRSRFLQFPEVLADDAFFDRMFDLPEKFIVDGARVGIVAPPSFRALFTYLTRVFWANDELNQWLETERPDRAARPRQQLPQFATFATRVSYNLHGRSTFDSFNPKKVTVVLIALAVRHAAKWNAKRQRKIGLRVSWR